MAVDVDSKILIFRPGQIEVRDVVVGYSGVHAVAGIEVVSRSAMHNKVECQVLSLCI